MKLIVGLGNPGKQYDNSRHNIGFGVVDRLARQNNIELTRTKHQARYGSGTVGSELVVLLKPQTYMNLSGQCVVQALAFYKVDPSELLIIADDMALELGRLRIRSKGSAGGHNGLQDIIKKLGHSDFSRLRIGIGAAGPGQAVGHVLGKFDDAEQDTIDSAVKQAAAATKCWIENGIDKTMNRFNPGKDVT